MGFVSGVCCVCGRFIPSRDFSDLRAVVLLKKRYCRVCTHAITAGASSHPFLPRLAALFSHGGRER